MSFLKNLFSKRYKTTLTVTSSSGFHLRPVAVFVSKAKTFKTDIKASHKDKTVNAKAINSLLSLNLDKGDSFELSCSGRSAQEALAVLSDTFSFLMQDETETSKKDKKSHAYESKVLNADIIAEGIAIAPLYHYAQKEQYTPNALSFQEAFVHSLEALDTLYTKHKEEKNADIYLAQKELLFDLASELDHIEDFESQVQEASLKLVGGKLEAKRVDYQDILQRVKTHLGYSYAMTLPSKDFILVAKDLLPSDIQNLEQSQVQAVILQKTSLTSHTAILLRSSGIASLIVTEDLPLSKNAVILDALAGILVLNPSNSDIKQAKEQQRLLGFEEAKSHAKRFQHALTKSGEHISVLANVSDLESAKLAKEEGAEGVGLLRTEFLFTQTKPSFTKQVQAYEDIFALFKDMTVRTLDVGGDKTLPYLHIDKEDNPFLGVRGVRLFKTHPDILAEQLHAIFLASKGKKVKVMFPMVSTVEEFSQAKTFAQEVAQKHTLDISNILFGIMLEVPSVLFLLEEFNKVVDFYSIGSNDLSQYLFATERTHPILKTDALSPVMFAVIDKIVKESDKPLSICGELASNKKAIKQLISLGIKTLSVS
ncbi:MAG: HPr family phosphocarrier protein, partial [Epsilonproteobacteria bacterium]